MRQIERYLCDALRARAQFHLSNTSATRMAGYMAVCLHGNLIAEVYDNGVVRVRLAGWNTPTTRSRCNAIMYCFGGSGISVVRGVPMYEGKPIGPYDWNVYYSRDKEK
jgi:hypothetical protein